ncbi:hypothetical protein TRFO_34424 [Tritrichomonas foetus]|uniref:Trichohyalin-plectin-homology domain-containing protein n=1 Tax=Tritrichomonas foetus TaxID=1144522 RepID=A0A1J4JNT3_9EUKA|nr:hypothetical protein TRFO_34424 [Tritrichomonas foetus]|eukprot:OHS99181.1 hypothetical protein TRFO_34424 [Tritrichomonas foetus]
MDKMLKTELICNRVASKAISAPADGELRPLHSKIAAEAIQKERNVQLRVNEEMKLEKMNEEMYWAEVERNQGQKTEEVNRNRLLNIKNSQKLLAKDYQKQFELHNKALAEEKRQQMLELKKLKDIQKEEERKEHLRQVELKKKAEERKKEFQIRNEELLQRREKRIEDDMQAELIIMKQHAENEKRMEERERMVKEKREEKNRIREKLITEQSKKLAILKAQEDKHLSAAESEIAKREEANRLKAIEKKKQMQIERNQEYNKYLREKDYQVSDQILKPDFETNDYEDEDRKFDEKMRKERMKKIQKEQMAQAAERRERERRERLEEIQRAKKNDTMYFLKDNEW